MSALRRQSGQATVMTVLFLVALIGITGAVLDVGSWFRADRKLQANSDAAALAGAQALPEDPGFATELALEYAGKNGGDVDAGDISFETTVLANDTIVIESERPADGVFTALFGIDSVEVHAEAAARTGVLSSALYVAPIVVNWKHQKLQCKPLPCFGEQTELEYYHLKTNGPSGPDGPGSFGFINLTGENNPGTSDLRNQILYGFDQYMDLGNYQARTGNPFSSAGDALEERIGDELLFPVYKTLSGTGSNAEYEIIGWVGFVITDMQLQGNNEKLFGYFTRVIWKGIASQKAGTPNFGAYAIEMIR
jgi:Putative Flp pilus-assembly TadE/G-like